MIGISDIPSARVATMQGDDIIKHDIRYLLGGGLYILVGVPGVFTPVCTREHLPPLIAAADDYKAQGIDAIYCISDDNPWAVEAWRKTIPGSDAITFLSDGNREFLNQIKLTCNESDLFLNGKYARFYAVVKDNKIDRVRFERTVLETVCTSGECILSDLEDAQHFARRA